MISKQIGPMDSPCPLLLVIVASVAEMHVYCVEKLNRSTEALARCSWRTLSISYSWLYAIRPTYPQTNLLFIYRLLKIWRLKKIKVSHFYSRKYGTYFPRCSLSLSLSLSVMLSQAACGIRTVQPYGRVSYSIAENTIIFLLHLYFRKYAFYFNHLQSSV